MKRLFNKLRVLITKDVSNETETKELAVLLRVLSLVYIIYFLITAVALAALYYYTPAFLTLIAVGLMGGCFISTYDNRTKLALKLFNIVLISAAAYLTLSTGWSMNFQWNILVVILVLFFSLETAMTKKLSNMKLLFALVVSLAVFSHIAPAYREGSDLFNFLFQIYQTIFYGIAVCIVAYFYCTKFNLAENKLRQSNQKLMQMASLDTLTGLSNRRSMNEYLSVLEFENNRTGKTFCIAIGDVDLFKKVNDNYGHDTGDFILVTLSEMFQNIMKGRGRVARWGGEEFLFCFEGMSIQQATTALEVLRLQIEKKAFQYKEHTLNITMTFGLEEYSQIVGIESTISKADIKLYEGKNNGRNQVVA